MTELKSLSAQLKELRLAAEQEKKRITNSDEYLELVEEIEDAEEEIMNKRGVLSEMLSGCEALTQKANQLEKEIVSLGDFDSDVLKPKFKNSNYVDTGRFYEVVNNLDEFLAVISITQTVVKNYANEHEDIKDAALDCIVAEKPTLIGFDII